MAVAAFFTLKLVSRKVIEDGNGSFFIVEVRMDQHGERLRLTYPLDELRRED